jgi:hypothetical protein
MLQIDHIYEFLYGNIFKEFAMYSTPGGVLPDTNPSVNQTINAYITPDIYKHRDDTTYPVKRIFFYDQEPVNIEKLTPYFNEIEAYSTQPWTFVTSEKSLVVDQLQQNSLYYFFHGFAALDWYRGYYALNCNKLIVKQYNYDFITFNRLITEDRSYRIYFVSQLAKHNLIDKGLISFGVADNVQHWRDELERDTMSKLSQHARQEIWNVLPDLPDRLYIDGDNIPGAASTTIARSNSFTSQNKESSKDALWHIVTETVFYYPKLHLTEKIFKPIVSKQPFMLLAAPGNLEYLRSYGFKTFEGIIDESYDNIQDDDARIDAVVAQMKWYCNLSQEEKSRVIERLAPIVEYNFQHFYGKFKEIITDELLENTKTLFKEIEYDDSQTDYATVRNLLTS